jgi:hypothetical protein
MTICATCKGVDFRALLVSCVEQCIHRQEADSEDNYEAPPPSHKHHVDIFEIEKSSQDCPLCKIIFQAFRERKVPDVEEARGLPIIVRAWGNTVEVCYDAEEGLIKLCGLNWYMSEDDGE